MDDDGPSRDLQQFELASSDAMKKAILIVLVCSGWSFAGGPKYTYPDVRGLDDEMQNIYHNISYPTINYGTCSSCTITSLTVSSMTVSSFTVTNETVKNNLTIPNGVNPTDAAAFGQIPTIANHTFLISVTGLGTLTIADGYYQQIGNMVRVWGVIQAGTVAGSGALSMAVPTGSIVYTNRDRNDGSQGVGIWFSQDGANFGSSNKFGLLFLDGSDTTNVYFTQKGNAAGTIAWPKPVPNTIINNTDVITFEFWYAIS